MRNCFPTSCVLTSWTRMVRVPPHPRPIRPATHPKATPGSMRRCAGRWAYRRWWCWAIHSGDHCPDLCCAVPRSGAGVYRRRGLRGRSRSRRLGRRPGRSGGGGHAPSSCRLTVYAAARPVMDEWTERILAASDPAEMEQMMATVLPFYLADPDKPEVAARLAEMSRAIRADLAAG